MSLMRDNRSMDHLLGTNEVYVAESIVTPGEQSLLVDWAEEQRTSERLIANPADPSSFSTPYRASDGTLTAFTRESAARIGGTHRDLIWIPEVDQRAARPLPDVFWSIRARVVDLLGLHALSEDPYKGSFLSYIVPGGMVHQHRDDKLTIGTETVHVLRCNVLFKRPEQGGMPVIGMRELDIADRGMWAFFPTKLVHSATPVGGSACRGLLSFGFVARITELWQRRFRIAREMVADYGLDGGHGVRKALIDRLRSSSQAATLGSLRLDLLEFVVLSQGDFTLEEAAHSLQRQPSAVWPVLWDLQRSRLVESHSSAALAPGKVVVF